MKSEHLWVKVGLLLTAIVIGLISRLNFGDHLSLKEPAVLKYEFTFQKGRTETSMDTTFTLTQNQPQDTITIDVDAVSGRPYFKKPEDFIKTVVGKDMRDLKRQPPPLYHVPYTNFPLWIPKGSRGENTEFGSLKIGTKTRWKHWDALTVTDKDGSKAYYDRKAGFLLGCEPNSSDKGIRITLKQANIPGL